MSFEYLIDPAQGPQWQDLLPGKPLPFVLRNGRLRVSAGRRRARVQIVEDARMIGTLSGGSRGSSSTWGSRPTT